MASSQPAGAPGAQAVDTKSAVAAANQSDCFNCMWEWATCGGPRSRLKQLYVHGKLRKCMDEYTLFKDCLFSKLRSQEADAQAQQARHPVWQIRTRSEAQQFWADQYEHLGARKPEPAP